MRSVVIAAGILLIAAPIAHGAEPVVGNWRTASGETARIAPCGGSYCITIATGRFKGRQIGRMSGQNGAYQGEITDPEADKTYAGSAEVSGASMKLTGCALKVFCKSQSWSKL